MAGFVGFATLTVVLNVLRGIYPAKESSIYSTFITIIVVYAVLIMCLFLIGAWKVRQLMGNFAQNRDNIESSSCRSLRLLPLMVRASTRCVVSLIVSITAAGLVALAHYSWRSLEATWTFVFGAD